MTSKALPGGPGRRPWLRDSLPSPECRRGLLGDPLPEEAVTSAHHERWVRVVAALTRRFGDLDIAGVALGRYQVLAAINTVHTSARDTRDTGWSQVLVLYDQGEHRRRDQLG